MVQKIHIFKFLFLFIAFFTTHITYGQILSYTNDVGGALNTTATNTTGTPLSRVNGSTIPGAPCGTGFSVAGFTSVTLYNSVLPAVEVTTTPNPGFTLNVTGFTAAMRRSASGAASIRYAYSTDGGTTWIDQGVNQSPNNAACGTTATGLWATSFSVPAPLQLKFRIYGFNASSTASTLQILNLAINGTVIASPACASPPGLTATFTTATSATLVWTATPGAISYNLHYRPSGSTTWISAATAGTSFIATGLTPSTVYECEVETVCSSGSSGYCPTTFFTTAAASASASSGKIAIYFNHPVNTAVSTGVNAVYLNNAMADTVIAYLDRAKFTVDIAQYDYNQSSGYSNIATAVNNCITRGVRVRWIYDGSQSNTGLALLSPSVHTLASPTTSAYGIMHNKFVVIDANSSNPNDAIVSTGSTNWGINQLNTDYNNTLFIQDSAFAHAYLNHFNMMWGDTGSIPNTTLSKFGPFKTDLGAHIFTIGGKTVEVYFSPSDHTDSHIQSAINAANTDLYFGVFTFTMASDANAIVSRHTAGVYTPGIVDENSTTGGTGYSILSSGLGSLLKTQTGALLYHSKMLIVDPSNTCSDPMVLTGSHNWTNAADTKNDENIVIIHNDTIANIYYQSFHANYTTLGGTLTPIAPCAITTCGTPLGLFASSVGTTTAILNWAALSGALSYNVQYRPVGSGAWSTTTSATNSVTISGLSPATAYEFQVQAVCASGAGIFSSLAIFTTAALPCSIPSGLSVSGIDTDIATLSWIAVSGAVSYNVQYRVLGLPSWTTTSSLTNSVTLSSLIPATTYEFQVHVVCTSGSSAYSVSYSFTTNAIPTPPSTCLPPGFATIPATGITGTTAILHWQTVSSAISYNIRYHIAGTGSWTATTSTGTSVAISGLTPWATYEFQVQAVCPAGNSTYSGSSLFTTPIPNGVTRLNFDDTKNLTVFPNPATGDIMLQFTLTIVDEVSLAVFDLVGRQIITLAANEQQLAGSHDYKISISTPGIYFVKLNIGNTSITKKVIKL